MIGHTKGAAGVTGMAKVALALHHKILPPTLGVEKPNESLLGGALYANTESRPWIRPAMDQPRRAAVSAFGFGGANYHVVVEEHDAETPPAAVLNWPCELFVWREASAAEILSRVSELHDQLKAGAKPALKDLSFTLWRRSLILRIEGATLAIVAASLDDLSAKLEMVKKKLVADAAAPISDAAAGVYMEPGPTRNPGVAFLFPGQGSQYPDMLRELAIHFREVREAFEAADRALAGRFARPLSSFVFPPPRFGEEEERAARQAITATNVAQPALGAAAMGLVNLLRSLGVMPDMVAGHSYGEYAALCAAGCLTADQLFALSESRGRFIMEEARGDLGTMAAVEADEEKTRALVGDIPDLWIANLNSPRQTIISGTKAAVAEALKRLETRDVAAQPIPVACAFHSPLVAPAKERLKEYLTQLRFEVPKLCVFSNATGGEYSHAPDAIRALLGEHITSPVRFVSEVEAMYEAGARVFVEVGPRNVLTGLTEQILADRERTVVPLETRKRCGLEALLRALAQLAAHGVPMNLDRLYEGREPREHNLDRLAEETQTKPPPATAWWVDGGHATPVSAGASGGAPEIAPVAVQPASSPSPAGARDLTAFLRAHEQVMQNLLDTHRRVMTAALGNDTPRQSPSKPASVAATTQAATASPGVPAAPAKSKVAATAATEAPPAESNADRVHKEVLRIVGERTGYPPDMLDVNADLEADLGIDSIKRVEIAGRLRKTFPQLGPTADSSKAGNLASLRTLKALIERIASVAVAGEPVASKPAEPPAQPVNAPATAAVADSAQDTHVPRFMMRTEDAPAAEVAAELPRDAAFLITDDGKGVALAVAEWIRAGGGRPVLVSNAPADGSCAYPRHAVDFASPESIRNGVEAIRKTEGRFAGIIHLLPLGTERAVQDMDLAAWRHALQRQVKSLFYLAQATAPDARASDSTHRFRILAAVDSGLAFPGHGGIPGMVNSLAAEWPGVLARTVALSATNPIAYLAERVMNELTHDDGCRFVSYHEGRRQRIRIESAELDTHAEAQIRIGSDWVILMTGGACGITAQVALEFAERFKPTLVLTGRSASPSPEEDAATRGVESPEELRRILANQIAGVRGKAAFPEIEAEYRRLCREREIRATLSALHAAGARGVYMQADVRNERSFGEVLDRIYSEFGRLDGVVYGAGTIEDKRVEDKTPESFDRVFDTKADGAFVLNRHLRPDSLKFVVYFSSVAYLGNEGQSDYAAANGVLNAMAHELDRRIPGRVVSLLWGPWQSAGMASEEVQRRFRERGIQVIPPAAGRRRAIEELLHGRKGDVEVLLGDAPYAPAEPSPDVRRAASPLLAGIDVMAYNNGVFEVPCVLDPSRQAYLRDHMLDGAPVFPAAMAMELMAEVACAASATGTGGIEITSLDVQHGIVLDRDPMPIQVIGERVESVPGKGGSPAFHMQIRSQESRGRAHYRATVVVGAPSASPAPEYVIPTDLSPFPMSVEESYQRWLFQGPCFAGIKSVEGIGKNVIVGMLESVPPARCLPVTSESRWLLDPTVLDASLQLVILWERHWHDMTPLPVHVSRFRLFGPLHAGPVRCVVKAATSDAGESLTADLYYTDERGRLLAALEGLQCACTKALNRLSSTAARPQNTARTEQEQEVTQ
jgi:acyl transferase domain-containing protein/short-subunit dehydrogenase